MTQLILWISLYWSAVTIMGILSAIVWSLRHPRRKATGRTPQPTPPTKPFTLRPYTGTPLPDVNVRVAPTPIRQSACPDWLERWRAEQTLVAHPELGDEYCRILRFDEHRKVSVR